MFSNIFLIVGDQVSGRGDVTFDSKGFTWKNSDDGDENGTNSNVTVDCANLCLHGTEKLKEDFDSIFATTSHSNNPHRKVLTCYMDAGGDGIEAGDFIIRLASTEESVVDHMYQQLCIVAERNPHVAHGADGQIHVEDEGDGMFSGFGAEEDGECLPSAKRTKS
eukprot:PhM_4_TR4989/c0_g3_i1/m.30080